MFFHGKVNQPEQIFFTFSTHDIIWWVGQVKYPNQNMTTLEWKLSNTTTENVESQFKSLTKQICTLQKICIYYKREYILYDWH